MSEETLITYCAPTMAGIKTANLFTCAFDSEEELRTALRSFNHVLVPRGICMLNLKYEKGKALIYVFRPDFLKKDMVDDLARKILEEMHYPLGSYARCLRFLMRRLQEEKEFPHEIGLFLGYPPEDVDGFIHEGPFAAAYSGCWRVYGDVDHAKALFASYKACTQRCRADYDKDHSLLGLLA